MRVDLPAPLAPRSAWISPRRTEKSTARSASVPPKRLVRPLTASNGSPARRSPLPEVDPPINVSVSLYGTEYHLMRLPLRRSDRQEVADPSPIPGVTFL